MCSALMKQSEKLPLQVEDYMTDCLIALLEFMCGGIKDVAARYYYTRIATVRKKYLENDNFSRSGKSQGILWMAREI